MFFRELLDFCKAGNEPELGKITGQPMYIKYISIVWSR